MGAHPYQYVVDYQDDLQAALDQLRLEVFSSGQYRGAHRGAKTPEDALHLADEAGTRSILDILRIAPQPGHNCASPLSGADLLHYFGTDKPTVVQVNECDEFWDDIKRGTARYVVCYEAGQLRKIFFAGYSFD